MYEMSSVAFCVT